MKKIVTALSCIAAAILVAGCAVTAPDSQSTGTVSVRSADAGDLARTFSGLAKAGGKVFALDPAASDIRIYVFRAGRAAAAGHNHVLSAPRFK